ncbi:DUF6000 family protein [Streptomyces sp. NPDC057877]|uniref:DUF6000 family protein n=1 Tax=Streptomyces sp. NPDC057877 TaxID=3346269 RepID=UPI003678E7B6
MCRSAHLVPLVGCGEEDGGAVWRRLVDTAPSPGSAGGEEVAVRAQPGVGIALVLGTRLRLRQAVTLVAVSRRTGFRARPGELLLASEVCCAGLAYSVAPASSGTARR